MEENPEIIEEITPQEIAEACATSLDENACLAISEETTATEAIELAISALTEAGIENPENFLISQGVLIKTDSKNLTNKTPNLLTDISEQLGRGQMINLLKKNNFTHHNNTPVEDLDRETLNDLLYEIAINALVLQKEIFRIARENQE